MIWCAIHSAVDKAEAIVAELRARRGIGCLLVRLLRHQSSGARVYDVNHLAGEAVDALVSAAVIGRFIVPFRKGLDLLSRRRAAEDK